MQLHFYLSLASGMDGLFFAWESLPLLLLGGCILLLLMQLYVVGIVHGKLAVLRVRSAEQLRESEAASDASPPFTGGSDTRLPPLSVVICTRNDERHLAENLSAVLEQDYPVFEVIVVNDRSEDDTKWLLKELSAQHAHLKVVEIAEHVLSQSGKKFGVAMGIKAAQYEHVVFTDADCRPASKEWLFHLGNAFENGKEIVLGYVPLPRKKGFRNIMIRFEHFYRSVDYLSRAAIGHAYMGLGQNMAFHKSLFFDGKGFASHIHVRGGYDELFVNQHASRGNTAIAIHREAHVWKPMPESIPAYQIHRKFRRQAVSLFRAKHRRMLNIQSFSATAFYLVLLGTVLYAPETWPIVAACYAVRLLVQYVVYIPVAKKLRNTRMLWFLPVLDVVHTFSRR